MRDRLIELVGKAKVNMRGKRTTCELGRNMLFADFLLANGVIVPPCKVGDTVYAVSLNTKTNIVSVHRGYIGSIDIRSTGNYLFICHEGLDDEPYFENICGTFDDFGKTVFLTREEAEMALKERRNEE